MHAVRETVVSSIQCPGCGTDVPLPVPATGTTIRLPADAYPLVANMAYLEREELRVILLNTKSIVLAVHTVYMGNVSASLVRVGELFTEAIRRGACRIMLVHNHPSGDSTPSPDDMHLTAEVIAAGRLLDIDVLDHIIVAGDGWTSLRERGMSFSG